MDNVVRSERPDSASSPRKLSSFSRSRRKQAKTVQIHHKIAVADISPTIADLR